MIPRRLRLVGKIATTGLLIYAALLGLLTIEYFQSHAVYLHALQMTGNKDLSVPEMFGFLRGQVTPFHVPSGSGQNLFAWHILPIELYRMNEASLIAQSPGLVADMNATIGFSLLRDDPEALLVVYFHGAGGNVASGYRVSSYKALAAGRPDKIHLLTFDYRGFGRSPGSPSENGIIQDATSVIEWALSVARIPPSRILIFGQSLGTAVNMAVADRFSSLAEPITFAGHIMVASFTDVSSLAATYQIAGFVPVLSFLATFPWLLQWLRSYISDSWPSNERIERYVRNQETRCNRYQITLLHAEDDCIVPWRHTRALFWHAVNASQPYGMSRYGLNSWKKAFRADLGAAGVVSRWQTSHGVITEHLLRYGSHDVIMGNFIVTLAAMRIFEGAGSKAAPS